MSLRRLLAIAASLAAMVAAPAGRAAAQQTDVIRGRITGPDSQAVAGVNVTVTSVTGNVNRTAKTDRNGRFTVTFPNGEGDYFVSLAAMGYVAKRFEVKRTADQEILVADAKLTRMAFELDPVRVQAQRERPNRNQPTPDVSGTERPVNNGAIPADQMGDIAAMAASIPGVQLVPGADGGPPGFSVLGLGQDQNNTTLNGMNFGGSNLPRDASVSSSLVTAPYDVSRGGFSGGQFNIRTRPGTNFLGRTMSLNLDAPQMQWTDRAAQALGQEYSNVSLGGAVSGPLKFDKAFYNVSYQLGRRANDLQTLLNTDPVGLEAAGIAPDSVTRLLDILQRESVPSSVTGIPGNRLTDQGSFLGSFDLTPPSSTTGQAYNVSVNGSWNKAMPVSGFTTELPAHSGERTNWNGNIQGRHTNYYGFGILSETQAGVGVNRSWSTPYLALPNGSVLVSSIFADQSSGTKNVAFGGSSSLNTSQTQTNINFQNQLSWFSENNKHRIKLTSELRSSGYSQDMTTNELGTFTFNSLADLEAGRPASFIRQLSPRTRSGTQLIGGVSLGDSYKRNNDLQIQYGVRLDGNKFLSEPDVNPEIERVFHVSNDRVPNKIYVSPRIGFSWTYGTAAQIGAFDGAVRGPRAVVRGGIGMFQNTPNTTLIGSAIDNTGLPSAVQQLICVGSAVPVPNWDAYAANPGSIPTRCADGSTGSVFASNAPNVTLFSSNYDASRSIRSNLQWNGLTLGNRFNTTIEATYSRNLAQPSSVDLNFNPTVRFTLADEGGRPVFVQDTSIVPISGAIASRDARVSQSFNRVTEQRSDLHSESRQLTVRVSPFSFNSRFTWSLAYVLSDVREQLRGFSSTVGNPLDVEWNRSGFGRHQISYNLGYNFFDAIRVNWFGSFRSGAPYTPLVAGDINGDGYANDRAFVFDPAHTADPSLAQQMRTLIDSASGSARSCLESQLGQLAGRNSCRGPWVSSANLSISFNPVKIRLPQRATLSFQIANPLGAADMLLHDDNHLRGWGQAPIPDQSLLFVDGFDRQAHRYKYRVNQRFGATNPAFTAFRAPVTVTAMMRFDIGPTRERQMLTQQLDRGRRHDGAKAPEAMIKAMFGTGGIPNPIAQILRQADTLHLTGPQADSIATINRWYTIRLDSIWTPVAKWLAALPDNYAHAAAYDKYRSAREASVDLLARIAPQVKGVLTKDQQRKLPTFVTTYLDTRYLASIRSGTAGGGFGGPMFMMGGMPIDIGGMGGGGGPITIVR